MKERAEGNNEQQKISFYHHASALLLSLRMREPEDIANESEEKDRTQAIEALERIKEKIDKKELISEIDKLIGLLDNLTKDGKIKNGKIDDDILNKISGSIDIITEICRGSNIEI